MTLTLVTLTIIGSLTLTSLLDFLVAMQGWILQCRASTLYCLELLLVFTGFNGHCHTCHSSILPVPSLPFGRGLGAQPPMPVSPRLRQPSLPSHAPPKVIDACRYA